MKNLRHLLALSGLLILAATATAQTAAELRAGLPTQIADVLNGKNHAYWHANGARVQELAVEILASSAEPTSSDRSIVDVYFHVVRRDLSKSAAARQWYVRNGVSKRLYPLIDSAEYDTIKSSGWVVDGVTLDPATRSALMLKFEDYAAFDTASRADIAWPVEPQLYVAWLRTRLAGKTLQEQYTFLAAESQALSENVSVDAIVQRIRDTVNRRMDETYVQLRRQATLNSAD